MPRISLWKPDKGRDFHFIDRQVKEVINMGGTGVYLHKYIGPRIPENQAADETTIADVVFMENRARKYDETIYELRGHYNPDNADFDLTQFGMFLSNDTIFLDFHLTDSVDKIGRKLMPGDVMELPHLREYFSLNPDDPATNKYFVIEDAYRGSSGYGPTWYPHIWRVKAKAIPGSEEYSDILGKVDGSTEGRSGSKEVGNLFDILSNAKLSDDIAARLEEEAACDMPYDPPYFEASHFYVMFDDNELPYILWDSGDGVPPNGIDLFGSGIEFPDNMRDGDYFLRIDFNPYALFVKQGCRFIRTEIDQQKCPWSPANRKLDTFINNKNVTRHKDGSTEPEKQPLSKVVKPKDGD